jgi:nucleoside-diphosphate-sugar epimerase
LCASASSKGFDIRAATREPKLLSDINDFFKINILNESTDWGDSLVGCDVLVHCAASAHEPSSSSFDTLSSLRRINVYGTINLARQAAQSGVRRFILLSSIAVNGSETFGLPFTAENLPDPTSPYAISKYEAEVGLLAELRDTNMEVVIIRPPLVYGPGASGKFAILVRCIRLGIPLPFGAVHNIRSFVALDNLVDLILVCATHPSAVNHVFLASDDQDISTLQFIKLLAKSLSRPTRLIPVPVVLMQILAEFSGNGNYARSFFGSLQVDICKTRKLLEWSPPLSLEEGLREISKSAD